MGVFATVAVEDFTDHGGRSCTGHQHPDRNQQDGENDGDSSEHQVRLASLGLVGPGLDLDDEGGGQG